MFLLFYFSAIAIHYETIIEQENPETMFLQKLQFIWDPKDKINITITVDGDTSETFLDTEEEVPSKLTFSPSYSQRIHNYSAKPFFSLSDASTNIIIKGFFDKATLDIESTIENSPKEKNATPPMFFGLFLIISICCILKDKWIVKNTFMILIFEIFICFSSINLRVSVKSYGLSIVPYRFPIKHSDFDFKTTDKAIQDILQRQNIENDFSHCKLCNFTPLTSNSNSSPKDFIVTVAYEKLNNINSFIRTARTSGIKAHIVIFTDQNVDKLQKEYSSCGVTFIKIVANNKLDKDMIAPRRSIRIKLCSYFLNAFPAEHMNRFLYSDLFDSLFQGDPFLKEYGNNSFVISGENAKFKESGWYVDRVFENRFFGYPSNNISDFPVICSGLFLAGYEGARFAFNVFANWFPYKQIEISMNDQIYFNFFVLSSAFRKLPYNLTLSQSGEIFSSLAWKKKYYTNSFPSIKTDVNWTKPLVLHQVNRLPNILSNVTKICR